MSREVIGKKGGWMVKSKKRQSGKAGNISSSDIPDRVVILLFIVVLLVTGISTIAYYNSVNDESPASPPIPSSQTQGVVSLQIIAPPDVAQDNLQRSEN